MTKDDVIALLVLEIAYRHFETVHCKDCKHYDGEGTCMKRGIAMLHGDWFCADGERKEKTDDKK